MSEENGGACRFGPHRLDPAKRVLLRGDAAVPLTPKVFDLLVFLISSRGRVVEKDELLAAIWPGTVVEENNLARNISSLRKALGGDARDRRYVVTVPGRGYCFVADVAPATDGATPGVPAEKPVARSRTPWLVGAVAAMLFLAVAVDAIRTKAPRPKPFDTYETTRLTHGGNSSRAAISPDGRFVAHVQGEPGRQSLRIRTLATGADIEIVAQGDRHFGGLKFSNASDALYFLLKDRKASSSMLYVVPAAGGAARFVAANLDSPVSFSPDGRRFAFIREKSGETALMTAAADGTGEERIASRKTPDFLDYPAWSPDGHRIACTDVRRSGDARVEVVEFQIGGGAERRITKQRWTYIRHLEWFSDGRSLLMTGLAPSAEAYQIFRLSYPSGAASQITRDLDNHTTAGLTADGSSLITIDERLLSTLWVAPDGKPGNLRQITPGPVRLTRFSWTSEGLLLYEQNLGNQRRLWTMKPDGAGTVPLKVERDAYMGSVSRDGKHVYYVSDDAGGPAIWRMDRNGANDAFVAKSGPGFPQTSPDGRWVVYVASIGGKGPSLWKTPAEPAAGGQPVQLYDALAVQPSVSPDGRFVACFSAERPLTANRDEPTAIAIVPFDGGEPVKTFEIPRTVVVDAGLHWTPDGGALAYVVQQGGVSNIWQQPVAAGSPSRLTDFGGDGIFYFDWSWDGKQLAVLRGAKSYDVVLLRNATQP